MDLFMFSIRKDYWIILLDYFLPQQQHANRYRNSKQKCLEWNPKYYAPTQGVERKKNAMLWSSR